MSDPQPFNETELSVFSRNRKKILTWGLAVCLITLGSIVAEPHLFSANDPLNLYEYIAVEVFIIAAWCMAMYRLLLAAERKVVRWLWVYLAVLIIFRRQLHSFWAWTVWSIFGFV